MQRNRDNLFKCIYQLLTKIYKSFHKYVIPKIFKLNCKPTSTFKSDISVRLIKCNHTDHIISAIWQAILLFIMQIRYLIFYIQYIIWDMIYLMYYIK